MLEELSRRRLLPAVSPAAGHITTPIIIDCQGCVEISAQRPPRLAQLNAPLSSHWATSVVRARVVGGGQRRRQFTPAQLPPA